MTYSLKKSQLILHKCFSIFKKKEHTLPTTVKTLLKKQLEELEDAIFSKDKKQACQLAKQVETLMNQHIKKSPLVYVVEIVFAILVALIIATIVRQMWFEPYEIPTGSMRPSFREKDRLFVTKTAFGLNVPLQTTHFYFDPDLVERGKAFIFTGANIPSMDEMTTFFWIFPYTKRYVKRLIGKPGDSLYFYGGKIYGVDKDNQPIDQLLEDPWMQKLEHIPFMTFEGEISYAGDGSLLIKHMNQPIGKLRRNYDGSLQGKVKSKGEWIKERGFHEKNDRPTFRDLYGIGNFAQARLLTADELREITSFDPADFGDGLLYLQLKHTPNLTLLPKDLRDSQLPTFESIIPLQKEHLQKIMNHMNTSRFVVQNEKARRYDAEGRTKLGGGNTVLKGVPDGTYEFINGKTEKVGFQGWIEVLSKEHPLYNSSPSHIQKLFNRGIEMFSDYDPSYLETNYYPHRYAYWRNGELYLMGAAVFEKNDPTLQAFVEREKAREKNSTPKNPYSAFIDPGPPIKNGKIDVDFVKEYGLKVPEKHYFALGDNHSMSKDSRFFGFVPESNIQGAPRFLIWPPGERFGSPPQTPYPFITLPRLIVWFIALIAFIVWSIIEKKKRSKRIFPH